MNNFDNILLEIFYILIGLFFLYTGYRSFSDKNLKTRYGTGLFWTLLSGTFILGPYIDGYIVGIMIVIIAILTATKQVQISSIVPIDEKKAQIRSDRIGNKIFIPSILIAVFAFGIAQLKILSGTAAIGAAAVIAVIAVIAITKSNPKNIAVDGDRLVQSMGAVIILPQLLAALGTLFTSAGVGTVITEGISGIIPEENRLFGVVAYCVGMALFTIIMGNGFAAFSVVTAGVGIPFVIMQGGNPAIVGALGLTAGYCGTLLTPMAANFNIVPVALLEIRQKYSIIRYQAPVAILALIGHIVLMYFLAFN